MTKLQMAFILLVVAVVFSAPVMMLLDDSPTIELRKDNWTCSKTRVHLIPGVKGMLVPIIECTEYQRK